MRIRRFLLMLVLLVANCALQAQDEAYTNERRNNAIDHGLFTYTLSYGSDFNNRMRIVYQNGYTPSANFTFGQSFIYSKTVEKYSNYGFGLYMKNHFLNGKYKPFLEGQINFRGIAKEIDDDKDDKIGLYIELSAIAGVSYLLIDRGSPIFLDGYFQYYNPFGNFERQESGLIPNIRFIGYF